MVGVAEGEAAGRQLPRRPQRLGQLGIVGRQALGQRRHLLLDAGHAPLVFLQILALLQIAPQQAHLLDQIHDQRGQVLVDHAAPSFGTAASSRSSIR